MTILGITKTHTKQNDTVLVGAGIIDKTSIMKNATLSPAPNGQLTTRVRRAADRGQADHGWLHARFTFSFSGYFDPDHMGFKSLRVMNNDTIEPAGGFPTHPHQDMEIFTYIIEGELAHTDSMGNGAVIKTGDFQYMSAGSGIQHSEFNPSDQNRTHLYQIWLHPDRPGGEPRYAEMALGETLPADSLTLLFSGEGREGSTAIRQDADISFGRADSPSELLAPASQSRPHAWLQVIEGELTTLGETLTTGDGIAVENAPGEIQISAEAGTKFLLFRLS